MSEDESQEKSNHESGQSKHNSQNSDHSDNESENKNESPDKIIDKVIKGIEMQMEGGINGDGSSSQEIQHIQNTPNQAEKSQPKYLNNEWENFSKALQTPQPKPNIDESTIFQMPEHSQNLVETTIPLQ